MSEAKWIGVDLDKTLAVYEQGDYKKYGPHYIGPPIPKMVARVKQWLAEGKDVRIFTARVANTEGTMRRQLELMGSATAIQVWCKTHIGVRLPITCQKDMDMEVLYDDRAVGLIPNTGERADGQP